MTITPSQAIDAYARTAATPAEAGGTEGAGTGFSDLLSRAIEGAVEAGRAGEHATVQAAAGGAALNDVVMAVNNAEITLQTVVAVRDRVIQAYQDIIRMPI